ncbi:MAG: ABC transporter ATP-binding protein [Oceanicaulis sp.]|jgi:putative ABC transport system ATP-binding protein|uniref:ABC transporter ATP-binding protein n=1 Tax=unclassified Oceanicaulis TaxID=2632123 RepID=UPI000066D581|nr:MULTISPECIES: ABC transporter ATP-binding protein [unclassified Oceanicaulis]EAP91092.1 ATP-binding protein of ABC transporter [Oceanicaulis sp. HTCC2633]MAB70180.1 ABC transporter ATP-binding protein [Oceanicaulis sp.]MBC39552.1 ABC transporter ATP-binding protein [Oceanicaulis sp.]MBG34478.1 ABC transporter ATP-binding protein [Oceanicaulis sp.]HBU63493.1 ABC transporter ATP-binding protein [Oceanicaulis sp.]|tara:strand:- start:667 stop:1350 length:684 start_codon:yes stop_codon:yes gene_type:complete
MTEPLIQARNLTRVYTLGGGDVYALAGVDCDINAGEYVAIMGPSGSGKSTFMNMVGALDRPSSGDLIIAGESLSGMSPDQLADFRNRKVGFVFQQFNLLPRTTALDNVALPLLYRGMPHRERNERAAECLRMVGLGERMDHHPSQLSGGQQQRVAIARALAGKPSILLADEPTGALDSQTTIEVLDILDQLNAEGITIVLVTHEDEVGARARRRIWFRDGLIVEDSQ